MFSWKGEISSGKRYLGYEVPLTMKADKTHKEGLNLSKEECNSLSQSLGSRQGFMQKHEGSFPVGSPKQALGARGGQRLSPLFHLVPAILENTVAPFAEA